ncbi:MAG TPA: PIN domain-containing protein [Vicinamibacterales bacterium]|nr:PIN domain-containing protein [Vicinamibacterales bacterium]
MALTIFLDTSVLLAGLVDFGPQSAPAQSILHAVAEKTLPSPGTAWHCCLEFYSVATRLPPEFRLTPEDANELLRQEVFGRLVVHDLPSAVQASFFEGAARERIAGGRIYDAHIAEVARIAGARVIVTDNRRHFVSALRHGIKVVTPSEFLASIKTKRG